ncbi:Pre-mRNA-splicing factor CWC2 [Mycena indigotica]|uniref:Pre-mRNA-splicing factor CWC2 n=1 Tax=Mycena indigotica TaxID=2126181 RepID=A0A8H6SG93_9AGAR|nr:Pre-mRNA-splicing factor CWC2 [Mycena indigotica]KAF7297295.1 Pre-mRNA-splicing factor CWC2 [Mycena indigotica]
MYPGPPVWTAGKFIERARCFRLAQPFSGGDQSLPSHHTCQPFTTMAPESSEVELMKAVAVVAPKKQRKLRPARKQVKFGDVVKIDTPQTGKEYNIWYNKWAGGDREDNYSNKVKSQTRCNLKRDSGLTRANVTGMKYTCLYFARGCCPYGWECDYLHALPDPDDQLPDTSKDCFAREKFADYRDDMGGVGSFNRQNRTLYVGRIKETGVGLETEEVVRRHFKEWGQIARDDSETGWAVKVLQYRSVAFVTYVSEIHAQFAKEAMACQSLDNDEILNVRWATEDPNPVQKVAEKRRLEEEGQEAIKSRVDPRIIDAMRTIRALEDGDELDEDGNFMDQEADGQEQEHESSQPDAKRRRLEAPPPPIQDNQPMGLLSADTLEGLKYFAEIQKRNGVTVPTKAVTPMVTPLAGGLGLGDYGSDEE